MKKVKSSLIVLTILIFISNISLAHGGNITAKFIMNGNTVTVRFLGIDTRETVHPQIEEEAWGKEASDFTNDKLKNATKIELEFDSSADEKDKYGRYLAWIWVDDELLQNLLVENGLAEIYMLQNNYKYAGILQESEEAAKNIGLGMWNDETNNFVNDFNKNSLIESINMNEKIYIIIALFLIVIFIITIFIISDYNKEVNNKKEK